MYIISYVSKDSQTVRTESKLTLAEADDMARRYAKAGHSAVIVSQIVLEYGLEVKVKDHRNVSLQGTLTCAPLKPI